MKNIFPVEIEKERKYYEGKFNQKAKVIWLTGLSGSGKTTIARILYEELLKRKFIVKYLDGDNVRYGINKNLGFSDDDRTENIRRVAEISKLFNDSGIITINCFISPTDKIRSMAKEIIGEERYLEVFINTPLSVCEERDVKGLYKLAREGKIKSFTGINSPFEEPKNPALVIDGTAIDLMDGVNQILETFNSELR